MDTRVERQSTALRGSVLALPALNSRARRVHISVQAISWVIEHSKQKSNAFVVLLMIANHAHSDGTNAWPSVRTLAREARISPREVQYTLRELERSGELVTRKRSGCSSIFSLPGVKTYAKFAQVGAQDVCAPPTHRLAPEPSFNRYKEKECPNCGLFFPPIAFRRHECKRTGRQPSCLDTGEGRT